MTHCPFAKPVQKIWQTFKSNRGIPTHNHSNKWNERYFDLPKIPTTVGFPARSDYRSSRWLSLANIDNLEPKPKPLDGKKPTDGRNRKRKTQKRLPTSNNEWNLKVQTI